MALLEACTGLKCRKIENRTDLDQPPQSRLAPAAGRSTMACHENEAGRPASTFSSVVDAIDKGRVKASSVIIWFCTPIRPSESVRVRPRRLGSPTSVPIRGAACPRPFGEARDVVGRPVQQPVAGKEFTTADVINRAEKLGLGFELRCAGRQQRATHTPRWERRRPPKSSRNVRGRPCRTRLRACANRVRGEISLLTSVLMAKCRAA